MTTTTSYTEELGRQRTPQFAVLFPAALPGGFSQVHRPAAPRLSKVVTAEGESQRLFSTRVGTKASEAEGMLQRPPRGRGRRRGLHAAGGAAGGSAPLPVVSCDNNNSNYYYCFLHGRFLARVCPWRPTNATVFSSPLEAFEMAVACTRTHHEVSLWVTEQKRAVLPGLDFFFFFGSEMSKSEARVLKVRSCPRRSPVLGITSPGPQAHTCHSCHDSA